MKKQAKNGANRCPNCGATDVTLDVKTGKLKCNFCRSTFANKKANAYGGVKELKGEIVGDGAAPIIPSEKIIVTLKCPACGAEVVINTDEAVSARCHWCRNTLSLNEKMKNGAVPDLVLPFSLEKTKAEENIREFVHKRRFFAHPTFRREFSPQNVMGVYLPYMVVDVNAHAKMEGEAEHLIRSYTSGGKNKTRYYDAEAFKVTREFDLYIDDLTIEASSEKLKQDVHVNTNNVINAIMPFDTDNCEDWNPNYLHGYASERRDTNVDDLREQLGLQVGDVARYKVKESMTYYNRGACWAKEDVETKGSRWKSAYLPVWLYSYLQKSDKGNMLHYVAVNGRTGETMGSVPINRTRLLIISALVEIVGIFLGWKWIKFWLGVPMDADDDNPALFGLAGLTPGFIFYWIQTARYRNMNARHKHEAETKADIENMKKTDVSIGRRNRLRNSRIAGQNDSVVKGVVANGGKKMMGEKMANWLGFGRMAGSKAIDTPAGQNVAKGANAARTILKIFVVFFIITTMMSIVIIAVLAFSNVREKQRAKVNGVSVATYMDVRSDAVDWAIDNGASHANTAADICVYTLKNTDRFSCYDVSDAAGDKFSLVFNTKSGNAINGLSPLEFATRETDELHTILVHNNVAYKRTTRLQGESKARRTLYASSSRYDDLVFCEIMEQETSKNTDDYSYKVRLTCISADKDAAKESGITY
ncbi:hypothetical protein IK110_01225 [Candidatus Saccharibacteria bacterium]|nr:hypothetical protein [Candidatus Saccharibacteria bacterium]